MKEKPFYLKLIKSKGKTVYVKGPRIFDDKGIIHIADNKSHTFCPKGSSIERFFKRYLR